MDESDGGNGGASDIEGASFLDGRMIFSTGRHGLDAFSFTFRFRFRFFRFVWVGFVPKPPDDDDDDDDDASLLSTELLGEAERVRCILDATLKS